MKARKPGRKTKKPSRTVLAHLSGASLFREEAWHEFKRPIDGVTLPSTWGEEEFLMLLRFALGPNKLLGFPAEAWLPAAAKERLAEFFAECPEGFTEIMSRLYKLKRHWGSVPLKRVLMLAADENEIAALTGGTFSRRFWSEKEKVLAQQTKTSEKTIQHARARLRKWKP